MPMTDIQASCMGCTPSTLLDREVRLPRELMDVVVAMVDENDLFICTLVSHHWHVSALPKLFHTIVIGLQTASFRIYLDRDPANATRYIKDLTIEGQDSKWVPNELNVAEVDCILAKLPALEVFRLVGVRLAPCPNDASLQGWLSPKALERLSLKRIKLAASKTPKNTARMSPETAAPSTFAFTDLLNLFGHVKSMRIEEICFAWGYTYERYWRPMAQGHFAAQSMPKTFKVDKLVSTRSEVKSHADLLQILTYLLGLHSLQSASMKDSELSHRRFLWFTGRTLACLYLRIVSTPAGPHDQVRDRYGLAYCESLSDLTVRITLPIKHSEDGWAQFLSVITLASSTVTKLTIEFSYFVDRDVWSFNLSKMDWVTVDDNLSSRAALANVTFKFIPKIGDLFTLMSEPLVRQGLRFIEGNLPQVRAQKTFTIIDLSP